LAKDGTSIVDFKQRNFVKYKSTSFMVFVRSKVVTKILTVALVRQNTSIGL